MAKKDISKKKNPFLKKMKDKSKKSKDSYKDSTKVEKKKGKY